MADTSVATGSDLVPRHIADEVFREYLAEGVMSQYMGTSPNSMIHVNEDLSKQAGDNITFSLIGALKGEGVEGEGQLEGNEEEHEFYSQRVTVDEISHAVRDKGVMTRQRVQFDVPMEARTALVNWLGEKAEKKAAIALHAINGVAYGTATEAQKDQWCDDNEDRILFGSATSNTDGSGGGGSGGNDHSDSLANVDSTNDIANGATLTLLKRLAKLANPKIRPLSVDGIPMYVWLLHPYAYRDFEEDVKTDQRDALPRGTNHPIFMGPNKIMYRGVLVVEWERCQLLSGVGASSIDVAVGYFCGAQALLYAQAGYDGAERMRMVEETFDYKRKLGHAVMTIYEMEKARFATEITGNNKDHGVITTYSSGVAD